MQNLRLVLLLITSCVAVRPVAVNFPTNCEFLSGDWYRVDGCHVMDVTRVFSRRTASIKGGTFSVTTNSSIVKHSQSLAGSENEADVSAFVDAYFLVDGRRGCELLVVDTFQTYWALAFLLGGVLFFSARKVTASNTTIYLTGAGMGSVLWLLFLLIFLMRFFGIGRKTVVASAMVTALPTILYNYIPPGIWPYLYGYVAFGALLGFWYTYRHFNEKDRDVLRWSLRLFGVLLMFFSTNHPVVCYAAPLLATLFLYMSYRRATALASAGPAQMQRATTPMPSPPTRGSAPRTNRSAVHLGPGTPGNRRMTAAEYEEQGRLYTQMELAKLRGVVQDDFSWWATKMKGGAEELERFLLYDALTEDLL